MNRDIDELVSLSKQEDTKSIEAEISIRKELAEEELANLRQDREERRKYAKSTFYFLCVFTGIVLGIVILSGFSCFNLSGFSCFNLSGFIYFNLSGFNLSDSVLITLITTSFSSVVGIFVLVMKYLFSNKK